MLLQHIILSKFKKTRPFDDTENVKDTSDYSQEAGVVALQLLATIKKALADAFTRVVPPIDGVVSLLI
jgi:hypothetical protein